MKQDVSPKTLAIAALAAVVVIGAIVFFVSGGRLGGGEPTQEQLGIGGGDVKPGELPEGVKYHDLGGSAGPSAGAPTTGSPTGPGQ